MAEPTCRYKLVEVLLDAGLSARHIVRALEVELGLSRDEALDALGAVRRAVPRAS